MEENKGNSGLRALLPGLLSARGEPRAGLRRGRGCVTPRGSAGALAGTKPGFWGAAHPKDTDTRPSRGFAHPAAPPVRIALASRGRSLEGHWVGAVMKGHGGSSDRWPPAESPPQSHFAYSQTSPPFLLRLALI